VRRALCTIADRRSRSGNHQQIAAIDQRFGRGRLDAQARTVDDDLDQPGPQADTVPEQLGNDNRPA